MKEQKKWNLESVAQKRIEYLKRKLEAEKELKKSLKVAVKQKQKSAKVKPTKIKFLLTEEEKKRRKNEYQKKRYYANPERFKAETKLYAEKNPEKIKDIQKKYKENLTPEQKQKKKEYIKQYMKKYRQIMTNTKTTDNTKKNFQPSVDFDKKYGTSISKTDWQYPKNIYTQLQFTTEQAKQIIENSEKSIKDNHIYEMFMVDFIRIYRGSEFDMPRVNWLSVINGMISGFNTDDILYFITDWNKSFSKQKAIQNKMSKELIDLGINEIDLQWVISPKTFEKIKKHLKNKGIKKKHEQGGNNPDIRYEGGGSLMNYLRNIRLDDNYHKGHPEDYPEIQQYRAEFGRKGGITFRVYPNKDGVVNSSIYVASIDRGTLNFGEIRTFEGKKDSRGEGAMAIASLFLKYPLVKSLHYEDESYYESEVVGFWQKIGGDSNELFRGAFFSYFENKFGYNPDIRFMSGGALIDEKYKLFREEFFTHLITGKLGNIKGFSEKNGNKDIKDLVIVLSLLNQEHKAYEKGRDIIDKLYLLAKKIDENTGLKTSKGITFNYIIKRDIFFIKEMYDKIDEEALPVFNEKNTDQKNFGGNIEDYEYTIGGL